MKKDIYIIKNDINDKVYIGQALDSEYRFISHCKKPTKDNSLIDTAIAKYGKEHFWFEVLESQIENYNEREVYWIKEFNSKTPNGYNIQSGGEEPPRYVGVNHPFSAIRDDEKLISLKNDLKNTTLSLSKIAKKYNISKKSVLRINQGVNYFDETETYPLRKTPNINGKITEEQRLEIIHLLKTTHLNYIEISKKFDISDSYVRKINSGKYFHQDNETYPIRKYKNSGVPGFNQDQAYQIIELLQTTKLSCLEISTKCSVPLNTVYNLNSGKIKRYWDEKQTYPIRKL